MRLAHDAQVMPVIASSISVTVASVDVAVPMSGVLLPRSVAVRGGARRVGVPGGRYGEGRCGGHGELCRGFGPGVLEVQDQPVGPGRGHLGDEPDLRTGRGAAVRVDVQVGEVAL